MDLMKGNNCLVNDQMSFYDEFGFDGRVSNGIGFGKVGYYFENSVFRQEINGRQYFY